MWTRVKRRLIQSPTQEKIQFLKSLPFFEMLNHKQLLVMSRILHERTYQKGEYIFEMGQPAAALFIIKTGTISIEMLTDRGNSGQIATLTDGDFLGELALLDDSVRSASARVVKTTSTFALFRNDLLSLIPTQPEIAAHVYKALALVIGERLKATNLLLGQSQSDHRKIA